MSDAFLSSHYLFLFLFKPRFQISLPAICCLSPCFLVCVVFYTNWWLQHSMKLESHNMTEIWYFLTAVLLCGSFYFHSNTARCRSAFNFEPNHSRITYLSLRSSYCRVSFTYHISWDKCSQKPQNLACLSESTHNLKKKCRNIAGPPTASKAMQPGKTGKEMKHRDVLLGSQGPCYLWINLIKPWSLRSIKEQFGGENVIILPAEIWLGKTTT